jgi:hypothetical protein
MADMPGCVLSKGLCDSFEKPFYRFLKGREAFLTRYAHRDEIEWKGDDCDVLKTQMRNMIVKREAGYPFTVDYERLWFHFKDLEHKKCNLSDLGRIKSAQSDGYIPYVVHDYDLRYHPNWLAVSYDTTHPLFIDYITRIYEPNVVVDVNKS